MTLIKNTPVKHDNPVFDLFNGFFDDEVTRERHAFSPASEIGESEDGYHISIALPGITKEQINIELDEYALNVSAEIQKEENRKVKILRSDFRYGRYEKKYSLPKDVEADKIKAEYTNGVLKLNIPKSEKQKPRKISVK